MANDNGKHTPNVPPHLDQREMNAFTFVLLMYCGDIIGRQMDLRMQKEFKFDRTMASILRALCRREGVIAQKDLANIVFRTKQATTVALDRLERGGFVERETRQRDDRRVNSIKITRRGVARFKRTGQIILEMSEEGLSDLTQVEIEQLHMILSKLMPGLRDRARNISSPILPSGLK